jgi:nicotinamide-nucleotide amidase
MNAEIIAVGTEILMGEVINSHAAWLSVALAELGIDVYYHTTVGDNSARMQDVFRHAARRADCLLITGGLGPTDDDITVEALADCFGDGELIEDATSLTAMQAIFERRQIPMPPSNRKQALRPPTAQALANPIGTAPGLAWQVNFENRPLSILAFPGVPRELYALWPQAWNFLQARQAEQGIKPQVLLSRFLHFYGISESALAERLHDLMQAEQPTLAPYVGKEGIRLRIAAKAPTTDAANALISPVVAEIQRRAGEFFVGEGRKDESVLERVVGEAFINSGWRLAVAESCTGGLISARLTDHPGSSGFIEGNLITYSENDKKRRLGIQQDTLTIFGVISSQIAREMALGLFAQNAVDIALSITGLAGPTGDDRGQEPGTAYIGIALSLQAAEKLDSFALKQTGASVLNKSQRNNEAWIMRDDGIFTRVFAVRVNSAYSRKDIKFQFSQYALFYLWQTLKELSAS